MTIKKMACITSLEQNTVKGTWEGVSIRTGETRTFRTLDDYEQYKKSMEKQGVYCADVEPISNIRYTAGKETTPTGFLQFRPRDPVTQAKYSAMSPTWHGVEASESAISQGLYDLDKAEATRRELREHVAVPITPVNAVVPTSSRGCSIQ
jgi:hypothetical protein